MFGIQAILYGVETKSAYLMRISLKMPFIIRRIMTTKAGRSAWLDFYILMARMLEKFKVSVLNASNDTCRDFYKFSQTFKIVSWDPKIYKKKKCFSALI